MSGKRKPEGKGVAFKCNASTKAIANSQIVLFAEGGFWHAYDQSAFCLCEFMNSFKVTTRFVKCVGSWVLQVGFPLSSLERWMGERKFRYDDPQTVVAELDAKECATFADKYNDWRECLIQQRKLEKPDEAPKNEDNPMQVLADVLEVVGRNPKRIQEVILQLLVFDTGMNTDAETKEFVIYLKQILDGTVESGNIWNEAALANGNANVKPNADAESDGGKSNPQDTEMPF